MKIRTNYVSNSSSSSFILDNKEDISYFEDIYLNRKQDIFSTNEIKETIINAIKEFTSNYDIQEEDCFEEVWDKYFEGKVPSYFRYYHISDWNFTEWNFSELRNLLKDLPDDKWLTDSYDRDVFAERCKIPYNKYKVFDDDL